MASIERAWQMVVETLSLEIFNTWLDKALRNLI